MWSFLPPLVIPKDAGFKEIISHTWALDVADDGARGVVHELDADLGDTTTGS